MMKKIILAAASVVLVTACSQVAGVMGPSAAEHTPIANPPQVAEHSNAPYSLKALSDLPEVKRTKRKAVASPELTADSARSLVNNLVEGADLSVSVEKQIMAKAAPALDHVDNEFTDESDVWVVNVHGKFTAAFALVNRETNEPIVLKEATFLLSVEDGDVLSAKFVPLDK